MAIQLHLMCQKSRVMSQLCHRINGVHAMLIFCPITKKRQILFTAELIKLKGRFTCTCGQEHQVARDEMDRMQEQARLKKQDRIKKQSLRRQP
jgi:hypothetical protein